MQVFLHELRSARWPLLGWSVAAALLVTFGMAKYAATAAAGDSVQQLMSSMPAPMRAILGIGTMDLTTALGHYGMLFAYIALLASVHAVLLGADILAKEERDHTAEFLYAKPVSRREVVAAKLRAALVQVLALSAVLTASSLVMLAPHGEFRDEVLLLMAGLLLLQGVFLLTGAAIAAVLPDPEVAATRAVSVLLGTYVLSLLMELQPSLGALRALSPFQYFNAARVLDAGELDPPMVLLAAALIVALLGVTHEAMRRRDLRG